MKIARVVVMTQAALLLLLATVTQHVVHGIAVELNSALARSYADPASDAALRFSAETSEPLPANLLMTLNGYYGDPTNRIPCAVDETSHTLGKNVTVLLALSRCLDEPSLRAVESWVDAMKTQELTFFRDSVASPITFATTVVSGACEQPPPTNRGYGSTPASVAMAAVDVNDRDLARVAPFARFGRVLGALSTVAAIAEPSPNANGTESTQAVAVVSFVNSAESFAEVEKFERAFQVRKAFNFQLCPSGTCSSSYDHATVVRELADLSMYSLFTATHTTSCPALEHGIPVSFVDAAGARQCFCTCPSGLEQRDGANGTTFCAPATCTREPSCVWNTHPFGYKHEVTTKLSTCTLRRIASDWGVPVPFPTDNYVADKRTNTVGSRPIDGPHVTLSSTKLPTQLYDGARLRTLSSLGDVGLFERQVAPPGVIELLDMLALGDMTEHLQVPRPRRVVALSEDGTSRVYAWNDYERNSTAIVDDVALTAFGKYALSVVATDYTRNATCSGCVAVVDKFRPKATTTCPTSFADVGTVTAEMSQANIARALVVVQRFFDFGDRAENDACSDARCDVSTWQTRSFFEASYTLHTSTAAVKRVFSSDAIASDLTTALRARKNPLAKPEDPTCAKQDSVPVVSGVCTRCAKLSTALQEFWTDYTCNYEYDVQHCDGDAAQTCAVEQCLVVTSNALATARVQLTAAAESRAKALGATAATEIRRDVPSGCKQIGSASGAACKVTAKVSDWLMASVVASPTSVLGGDATKFVYWRYRVGSSSDWKLWGGSAGAGAGAPTEDKETFVNATTSVVVEAWTACGRVSQPFAFTVVLVLPKPSAGYYSAAVAMLSGSAATGSTGRMGVAGDVVATSLAACALVALVALVVAQRRRWSAATAGAARTANDSATRFDMDDTAYRPLLE